jgi:toxin secretion/phage lysis holin
MKKFCESLTATAGAAVGFLFGELDGLFYALIALVLIDYITGLIVAIACKNLSSNIGFKGICKKIMMFAVVAVAHIIDSQVIKSGQALRTAALFLFIANEGVSIVENAASMGLPIPDKVIKALNNLRIGSNKNKKKGKRKNELEDLH